MNRVCDAGIAEAVGVALDYLPCRVRGIVETADFLLGADPLFVGLHRYEAASTGRSYRDTAHVSYPFHSLDGQLTLVMTPHDGPCVNTLLHEFGHVLDARLCERLGKWPPAPRPLGSYAAQDRWEAFACAFHSWCVDPAYADETLRAWDWGGYDAESRTWFDRLAAGDL